MTGRTERHPAQPADGVARLRVRLKEHALGRRHSYLSGTGEGQTGLPKEDSA
ncbi:hypothetical protein [Actinoplanes sp. NPDC049265]|uniref:hypothetical protein n=1 Tax=Actinoplanes sp. NPDC049265 TaxID=3363902 RepID=UPI00371C5C93